MNSACSMKTCWPLTDRMCCPRMHIIPKLGGPEHRLRRQSQHKNRGVRASLYLTPLSGLYLTTLRGVGGFALPLWVLMGSGEETAMLHPAADHCVCQVSWSVPRQ